MEIERQFLVNFIPPLPEDYEQLRQGYISLEPEIRIRQAGDHQFFLTVKRGNGRGRRSIPARGRDRARGGAARRR